MASAAAHCAGATGRNVLSAWRRRTRLNLSQLKRADGHEARADSLLQHTLDAAMALSLEPGPLATKVRFELGRVMVMRGEYAAAESLLTIAYHDATRMYGRPVPAWLAAEGRDGD